MGDLDELISRSIFPTENDDWTAFITGKSSRTIENDINTDKDANATAMTEKAKKKGKKEKKEKSKKEKKEKEKKKEKRKTEEIEKKSKDEMVETNLKADFEIKCTSNIEESEGDIEFFPLADDFNRIVPNFDESCMITMYQQF